MLRGSSLNFRAWEEVDFFERVVGSGWGSRGFREGSAGGRVFLG